MKTLVGLVLIVVGVVVALWRTTPSNLEKFKGKWQWWFVLGPPAMAVVAGVFFIIEDRVVELDIPHLGTIKTATEQAVADAKTISDLKERVQNQSATVDLIAAQSAQARDISKRAADETAQAEAKLAAVTKSLDDAETTLNSLHQEENVMKIILSSALGDDRRSFDVLNSIAQNKSSPFAGLAAGVYNSILTFHGEPFSFNYSVTWRPGVDPHSFDMQQLSEVYTTAPVGLRPGVIQYVESRNDIPKSGRLEFFINIIENDTSLTAVEYASRSFTTLTGKQFMPLAVDSIVDWWKQHREEFTEGQKGSSVSQPARN